jgi:hypothetical protein
VPRPTIQRADPSPEFATIRQNALIRRGFARIVDHRPARTISLIDALMSAFAMFSLKCPSLLAFDEKRSDPNLRSVYGIERAPCDTQMRETLDPVDPAQVEALFKLNFPLVSKCILFVDIGLSGMAARGG